jgi:hypothetical protein
MLSTLLLFLSLSCRLHTIQVGTSTSANMYLPMGVDNSWDLKDFADNLKIKINRVSAEEMEFDMIGYVQWAVFGSVWLSMDCQ